jgi:hypothetical protein
MTSVASLAQNNMTVNNALYFNASGNAPDGFPWARLNENWGIRFNSPDPRWVFSSKPTVLIGYVPSGQNWGNDNLFVAGNVGIGTTSPYARLHVSDGGFRHGAPGEISIDAVGIVGGRFKILDNGNVGIGTTSPSEKLEVNGNLSVGLNAGAATGYGNRLDLRGLDDAASFDPMWLARYNVGANQTELRVNIGDDSSGDDAFTVGNFFHGDGQWKTFLKVLNNGNVGIGTSQTDAKLTVNGSIHGKEVKVDLNVPGPDYVFEPTYDLKPLAEIETYIKENKHLPEVPSAKEMEKNGVQLGEMNMLLLKKVEELTLHLIEMKKENNELKARVEKIENKK